MFFLALKTGFLYFLFVFSTGFALGIARVLWAVPRFGTRAAELMEMPFMFVVMVGAGIRVIWRWEVPTDLRVRLGMGITALGLLLFTEFGAVLQLQGLSIFRVFRKPRSGFKRCLLSYAVCIWSAALLYSLAK